MPEGYYDPATRSKTATLRSSAPRFWQADGVTTQAGGIFFLLNALARLGIEKAIAAGLTDACPDFIARLFLHLAAHAEIAPDDPIASWLESNITDAWDRSAGAYESRWWPSNVASSSDLVSFEDLLRVWAIAVRRYCWRTGRIAVREIVARRGLFSVNRTDLDVSLPLEEAEIRIRRIGLDLDPGWLPWFGRVVRFHYLYRREFHG